MTKYTNGFKAKMVQRMAGPESISAMALAEEVGVSQPTLSRWLREARTLGLMTKSSKKSGATSRRRTAEDKFRIVLGAAGLTGEALGEFLRKEGGHTAELEEWRAKATTAGTNALKDAKRKKTEQTPEARENRELKRELLRKERALAEAAALLMLQKNCGNTWREGTTTRTRGAGHDSSTGVRRDGRWCLGARLLPRDRSGGEDAATLACARDRR